MKKLKEKLKQISKIEYVALLLTMMFLLVSISCFSNAYVRIWESIKDIWSSFILMICKIFSIDVKVNATVTNKSTVPFTPIFNLPATWAQFKIFWHKYWKLWATGSNVTAYFVAVSNFLVTFCKIVLLVIIPLWVILRILFVILLRKSNNNYNKDSKALINAKKIATKVYIPIKKFIIEFILFIKNNKVFWKIWLIIWAFNFNFVAIIIECLAYYIYFMATLKVSSIYLQFYKLACDLSVMFAYIPLWCWIILGCIFICKLRRKIGYARLQHFENRNCGFINERPIVLMLVGTMGKKKTTVITDIALSQEKMLRDKALELMLKNDLKFPYFPWINLKKSIKYAVKTHQIYNLATARKYVYHLAYLFYFEQSNKDESVSKSIKRHLRRRFNIDYKNLCFDYDFERYGLTFDDKLKVVDLWQVIETYTQLYFIYIIQSSLIISNYSIRTDNLLADKGNFPMWDTDFFKRDSKQIDLISRHAHTLDFDALRLGRKVIEDNEFKDSFDFGVVNITEVGKERKNNLELQGKKALDEMTNQKNDGFNDWLKMVRHSATVDYFPFVKVITDEQRPESWGADARDLTEIVHIDKSNEQRLAMPFFTITELLYYFIFSKFENLYYQYRFNRSDNTLPMYLLKKITAIIDSYYNGIYNTFGYCKLDFSVENGTQDGQTSKKYYYLMNKKIYSNRFSTDCFSDFFTDKNLKSPVGINDLPEYATEKATFAEMQQQNSYFINNLIDKQNKN